MKIIDTGITANGNSFMVMEYLTGETLDKLLAKGRLPNHEAAQLMLKIGNAVTELHETSKGIIHRDLKPSNIMVERRKGSWKIKLFDLGIARLDNPLIGKPTTTHIVQGTPFYMAPEQFHGTGMAAFGCQAKSLKDTISPATDIYALGVIAYEMLVGLNPFHEAASLGTVVAMQREQSYIKALNREVPLATRAVVLKAMAFCPDNRYQKAEEFAKNLATALTSRHRFRINRIAAAVVLLLLLSLGAGWLSGIFPPSSKNQTAEDAGVNSNVGLAGGNVQSTTRRDDGSQVGGTLKREVTYWFVTQETQERTSDR